MPHVYFYCNQWKIQNMNEELTIGNANYPKSFMKNYLNFTIQYVCPVLLGILSILILIDKFSDSTVILILLTTYYLLLTTYSTITITQLLQHKLLLCFSLDLVPFIGRWRCSSFKLLQAAMTPVVFSFRIVSQPLRKIQSHALSTTSSA